MKVKITFNDNSTLHLDADSILVNDDVMSINFVNPLEYIISEKAKVTLKRNVNRIHAYDKILSLVLDKDNTIITSYGGTEYVE